MHRLFLHVFCVIIRLCQCVKKGNTIHFHLFERSVKLNVSQFVSFWRTEESWEFRSFLHQYFSSFHNRQLTFSQCVYVWGFAILIPMWPYESMCLAAGTTEREMEKERERLRGRETERQGGDKK